MNCLPVQARKARKCEPEILKRGNSIEFENPAKSFPVRTFLLPLQSFSGRSCLHSGKMREASS